MNDTFAHLRAHPEAYSLESFEIPSSIELVKSGSEEDNWCIKGIAATQDPDIEDDALLIKGLDIGYLEKGRGTFNWNHAGDKDPSSVVGLVDAARRVEFNSALEVEGHLLKSIPKARAIYELMKALEEEAESRQMGMSVEGKILKRDGNIIVKAWCKAVALTMDPINPNTYVSLIKSLQGSRWCDETGCYPVYELEKALATTSPPLTARGTHPLAPESLEKDEKDLDFAGGSRRRRRKKRSEKMDKAYSFGEAVERLTSLDPRMQPQLARTIVRHAISIT